RQMVSTVGAVYDRARFFRAAQQSIEFARKARGHRPRLQLTEYRLNRNSSTSGVLRLPFESTDKWCSVLSGFSTKPANLCPFSKCGEVAHFVNYFGKAIGQP